MKQKIEEVQQYFINKLVNADFEIKRGDSNILKVIVDGKYPFVIWIANDQPEHLGTYSDTGDSFMLLPEFTTDQKNILYEKIKDEIFRYTDSRYRKINLVQQIAELQNELDNLK